MKKVGVPIVSTYCLFVCFLASIAGFAQPDRFPLRIPLPTPMSPEMHNLGRYGEVAVGEYTGTPSISVPLHTIRSGKLEFPLSLYYDASGVRVNQEATWVGLGFQLSAVAGITHIPAGGSDYNANNVINPPWEKWKTLIDYINPLKIQPQTGTEDGFVNWGCSYNGMPPVNTPAEVINASLAGKGQRDLFSVNCLDMSFKFYLDRQTGSPIVHGEKNNVRIEVTNNNIWSGFKLTDAQGVMYSFQAVEATKFNTDAVAWYLTEIRRPDGDWLKFTYANYGVVKTIPAVTEQYMPVGTYETGSNMRTVSGPPILGLYLTSIEGRGETVKFNLGEGRIDIGGDGARHLESIDIVDKFSGRTKTFAFEYDYFTGDQTGGSCLDDDNFTNHGDLGFTFNNLSKRLKLLRVIEKDASQAQNKKYSFAYDEARALPLKTSFAVDHWGYYNGQENGSNILNVAGSKHTFVPTLATIHAYDPLTRNFEADADLSQGAYRGPVESYMKAALLKSIQYPTGGKTVFTFEPHDFDNEMILTPAEEIKVKSATNENINVFDLQFNDPDENEQYVRKIFTLERPTVVDFSGYISNKNMFTWEQIRGAEIMLFRLPGVTKLYSWKADFFVKEPNKEFRTSWSEPISLPAGQYMLLCSAGGVGFTDYTPVVAATIQYRKLVSLDDILKDHVKSTGGGLRIARIDNYDADQTKLSSREYHYTKADGKTSGRLVMPIRYGQSFNFITTFGYEGCGNRVSVPCVMRYSSSYVGASTSPVKAVVGYSRVEIVDTDRTGARHNGKTVKEFKNEAILGTFFNDIVLYNQQNTGELASVTYFNQQGEPVRSETYDYTVYDVTRDWTNVKSFDRYVGRTGVCTASGSSPDFDFCAFLGRYTIGVFPYENYRKRLAHKIVTDYTPEGNVSYCSDFSYHPVTYALQETVTTGADDEIRKEQILYPRDVLSELPAYQWMLNANMVEIPVEQRTLRNDALVMRQKTTYANVSGFLEPSAQYEQTGTGPLFRKANYRHYVQGNIAEYATQDDITHAVLWGYNEALPVAIVDQAAYKNVYYNGFEEPGQANRVTGGKTGRWSAQGPLSIPLTGLDNGSYRLSYWLMKDNAWTLQQKTILVTSGNAYTLSFASGEQVDDVRFHPTGSEMTTYTYDPVDGMTSMTDKNHVITFYEYDSFGRLKTLRDQHDRIRYHYDYRYKDQ
jgi:YD repeat-containing protein